MANGFWLRCGQKKKKTDLSEIDFLHPVIRPHLGGVESHNFSGKLHIAVFIIFSPVYCVIFF